MLLASTMWLCDIPELPGCHQYFVTPVPLTTSTTTVTTSTTTSTTTLPLKTWGYMGVYDNNGPTVTTWPTKLTTILAGPDGQGSLISSAKSRAIAAGNTSARFLFYLSLGDMDSKCACFEQRVYDALDPSFTLKDASGNKVSTNNGINRVYAMDIGNPAFIDAWVHAVNVEITTHGWDGVLADNVNRCNGFWGWSAKPINPRTGSTYLCSDYRRDLADGLKRIKASLNSKLLYGNHGGAWNDNADGSHTFQDPFIKAQVLAMDGVQLEDCVFKMDGTPYNMTAWLDQVRYMQFAVQAGKTVLCEGYGGVLNDQTKRQYIISTAFLVGAQVGQLNNIADWKPDYTASVNRCP